MSSQIIYKKKSNLKKKWDKLTLPLWRLYYKIKNIPSRLRHRFIYKRYLVNMPKINKWRYYDQDEILLHANMQVLCDFIEHEDPFSIVDYEHDPEYIKVGNTLKEIYAWWKNHENRRKEIDDAAKVKTEKANYSDDPDDWWDDLNKPMNQEEKSASDKWHELEEKLENEEQEMLHKLIDIRFHLWT